MDRSRTIITSEDSQRAEKLLSRGAISADAYLGMVLSVEPLIDAISDEDWKFRCKVARSLGRNDDLGAVKILKKLLDDPSEQVRAFAASSLDRIEERRVRRLQSAKASMLNEPDVPGLRVKLGKSYMELAELKAGIDELYYHYIDRALEQFGEAVAIEPDNMAFLYEQAVAHLHRGNVERAVAIFEKIIKLNPYHIKSRFGLAMLFYDKKLYSEVERQCKLILESGADSELADAANFWVGS